MEKNLIEEFFDLILWILDERFIGFSLSPKPKFWAMEISWPSPNLQIDCFMILNLIFKNWFFHRQLNCIARRID